MGLPVVTGAACCRWACGHWLPWWVDLQGGALRCPRPRLGVGHGSSGGYTLAAGLTRPYSAKSLVFNDKKGSLCSCNLRELTMVSLTLEWTVIGR